MNIERSDFLNDIKFDPNEVIKMQQGFLENVGKSYLDIYKDKNAFDATEYMCYLAAAIHMAYRRCYPELSVSIPFRTKSDNSYSHNIPKEFKKGIYGLAGNKNAESLEYLQENYDKTPTIKDIQALTVVLDHFRKDISLLIDKRDDKILSDGYVVHDYMSSEEVQKLLAKKEKYRKFIIDSKNNDGDIELFSEKQYLEKKLELLEAIIDISFPEFTEERIPSFQDELATTKIKLEEGNFASSITSVQEEDLKSLFSDLASRLDNMLEYAILDETLPTVLNHPFLKDSLGVTFEFSKYRKKPNGFAAYYYILHTPYDKIELLAESDWGYYNSKRGSAFHSGEPGKSFDPTSFFEYVNPENETMPLDKFLEAVDKPERVLETPKLANIYKEKLSHIKIKDKINVMDAPIGLIRQFYPDYDPEIYDEDPDVMVKKLIDEGKISEEYANTEVDTNEYLYNTAISYSPALFRAVSGSGFSLNAAIQHQDIVDEFTEVLRKKDSMTLLGNLLLERLSTILETTKKDDEHNVRKNEFLSKLPKQITYTQLIEYGERLKDKKLESTESELEY